MARAGVSINDRGYQFSDGVYEVWAVFDSGLADAAGHFARLARSLGELRIPRPMSDAPLRLLLGEVIRRNGVRDGLVYLQISRGVAPRDHSFPVPAPAPSLVITAKSVDMERSEARAAVGIGVVTTSENRWSRCDIKTIGLLPNVLAKQAAKQTGAGEAWFVDNMGLITEGGSSNAWIIDAQGLLRTRDIQSNILRGVTRASIVALAAELGLCLETRAFTVEEALASREAFVTGAGSLVLPVVRIDGKPVGDGAPGPVAKRLRQLYIAEARRNAARSPA